MNDDHPGRVEDYTNAFLGMFYLILVMLLVIVWGVWGYPVAVALCGALHWAIARLGLRRARSEAARDARIAAIVSRQHRP